MKIKFLVTAISALMLFVACAPSDENSDKEPEGGGNTEQPEEPDEPEEPEIPVEVPLKLTKVSRDPWSFFNPLAAERSLFSVTHEPLRLEYFGASLEEDASVTMTFPESTEEYNRAILTYRMGGWNEGPAEWDITTQIMVFDKASGEYYEIARAFTPYGGSFDSDWSKTFYLDVTEYLPMLTGETEFRIYYGGWDATETHAHTVTMTYDFYSTEEEAARTIYSAKLYDSRYDHNGYRGWAYGIEDEPIEADNKLGMRELTIPEGVKSLLMKVSITGHGMDPGTFPDRPNYRTKNAAEFDENTYDVIINGKNYNYGRIFYDNTFTYPQAGTYKYDRANWGPGLPTNTHFWKIDNIPTDRKVSVDLNLERYICADDDNPDTFAYYIIQVDVFGV